MYTNCPSCGVRYESEPGFFWGAMYFGYAINVALIIVVGFFHFGVFDSEDITIFGALIIGLVLLLIPVNFRVARLMMMYVAAPYRKYNSRNE